MEKTPGYFINKNAPHRIKRMDPNIKLGFIYSQYERRGHLGHSFEQ
jgi:hypothetical protein